MLLSLTHLGGPAQPVPTPGSRRADVGGCGEDGPMSTGEQEYRAVPGSGRTPRAGARRVGAADLRAVVEVVVVLRRHGPPPSARVPRAEAARLLGADPGDVEAVRAFAARHGLHVDHVDLAARSIGLTGTVAAMNRAFRVDLGRYSADGVEYRGREGEIQVPAALHGLVVAVLGLDDRPQASAHFRVAPSEETGTGEAGRAMASAPEPAGATSTAAIAPRTAVTGYWPQEVAARYDFPTAADGSGQTVAVIELGGALDQADVAAYFTDQGLQAPEITVVPVDGATPTPSAADGEVALDVEVIGAVAQGARQAVYVAPNTTRGFYDAVAAALHDSTRTPSVVSISWGGPESSWTDQAMDAYDALFADADALGVSVFCASGDDGASDRVDDGSQHVDFPASSPHVVGCGGTTLAATAESVWNDLASGHGATGGGVSRHFPPPDYQRGLGVPAGPTGSPGRGVPDVAGNADPMTGYRVRVGGRDQVIGGTSAVAPLWAALTALTNQTTGRPVGTLNPVLYRTSTPGVAPDAALHDIVDGDNGHYRAGPGWDACTGWGRPVGTAFVDLIASQEPSAGG
jgi:kumamolisin